MSCLVVLPFLCAYTHTHTDTHQRYLVCWMNDGHYLTWPDLNFLIPTCHQLWLHLPRIPAFSEEFEKPSRNTSKLPYWRNWSIFPEICLQGISGETKITCLWLWGELPLPACPKTNFIKGSEFPREAGGPCSDTRPSSKVYTVPSGQELSFSHRVTPLTGPRTTLPL